MKKYIISILFTCLLAFASYASAEGNCPPGHYPIGGGGAIGCAPIPGYGNQQQQQAPAARQPQWKTTWGAIAINSANGSAGVSTGKDTQWDADHSATEHCRSNGGGDGCEIRQSYNNQCAVIVWGDKFNYTVASSSIQKASEIGMKDCTSKGTGCKLYYTNCTEPYLVY